LINILTSLVIEASGLLVFILAAVELKIVMRVSNSASTLEENKIVGKNIN
jgi:hypothetical protein